MLLALRAWGGGGKGFASNAGGDLVQRGQNAAGVIVLAKVRRHLLVNDAGSGQVGNGAFQRARYFQAHAPVVFGHYDQQTIAYIFAADLPAVGHAPGVGSDVFWRRGGHHQHHHLGAGFFFDATQAAFHRQHLLGRQGLGLVNQPSGERRHRLQLLSQGRLPRQKHYKK